MFQTVSKEQKKFKCLEKLNINLTAGERVAARMAPKCIEPRLPDGKKNNDEETRKPSLSRQN
jgi:hypothetical protein